MTAENHANRRIVLASRPSGAPVPDNFRLETPSVPEPSSGQVLLRTLWLSLDPYMRGRMSEAPSYAPPVDIGEVMVGGTVSQVVTSNRDDFAPGDLVLGVSGWQEYALSDGSDLTKLPRDMTHPSWALGVLGMPGFTAWHGLLKIGEPKAGETVVVAAASGPVGATVGQIAKIRGARVIGVAGGERKCRHVVQELGFDACIDHRAPDFAAQLKAACPGGIDVYFENVGGMVFDAVLPLLNDHARMPVCGVIAHYNDDYALQPGPDRLPYFASLILRKRFRVQGFIITDHYADEYADFARQMGAWVHDGRVRYFEDIVDGLEKAPDAFIGLLEGRNNGKLVVRMSND
ncbi:NADP-dependent oxidoreductase [Gluconacetobacter azotocaptans]|uniref:NADP-dependent oxidoreductase n=1 Tax=Gluconacetobacter azotocaptans TaxID=142834 RepID=UPI00195F10CD|nr:NADP-dependent oxidoreductase [Gluconacetobacter azotocaptans]MBM9400161.1 NADP-dependent oxidoreductase [Gluconacetobacter azotocaptans]